MNTSLPTPDGPRVVPDARHAFGGIWRLTAPRFLGTGQLLLTIGLLGLLGLLALTSVHDGAGRVFFNWTVSFYLTFLVPVLSFLSGAGAIRDEMKPVAADYVLTRPVGRPALVVFKYLSHLGCLQLACLLALGVLAGVGLFRHIPGVVSALPLLVVAQVLTVAVFTAFGFFSGSITAGYIVFGLTYGSVVEAGIGQIPTQLGRLSITHQVKAMLQPVLVDAGGALVPEQSIVLTIIILISVTVVMVVAAAAIFAVREFAGARPKDE